MKYVHFEEAALPVADWNAEKTAEMLIHCNILMTSNALVVDFVRALVAEGVITDQVTILFKGQHLLVDANGRIENWPNGFADEQERALERILKAGAERYRLQKK